MQKSEQALWAARRRARHDASSADDALALCHRSVRAGDLAEAARAALLAERLARLDAAAAKRKLTAEFAAQRAAAALNAAQRDLVAFERERARAAAPALEFTPAQLAGFAAMRRQALIERGLLDAQACVGSASSA